MNATTVTKHGKQRLRERAGIKGSAAEKTAERAFQQGVKREETAGNLYKWLTHVYVTHENISDLRVFNYKVYVFDEGRFVTVLDLPREYKNAFEKARGKLKKEPRDKESEENQMSEMTITKEAGSMNELTIIKSENFGAIQCDFYQGGDEYYMSREQIGQALEYGDPQKAIDNIHARHAERLDKHSVTLKLRATDGKSYSTTVYTRKGVMEICRWSQQPRADAFMDFVWETMDDLITGKLNKPLSPAEITLMLAQQQVELEQRQREQQVALTAVEKRMDTIGDLISLNPNDWRRESKAIINRIAETLGGFAYIRDVHTEIYRTLRERFSIDVKTRLTNLKRRAAENGMCKSKRDNLNALDVIAEDKRAIEAYLIIVKEMAIKHGVDKGAINGDK